MADPKAKFSFRSLLERHVDQVKLLDMFENRTEGSKATLLDNLVKEINGVDELRKHLQNYEKEANVYARYLQILYFVRAIVDAARNSELFDGSGNVKNKELLEKSLQGVAKTINQDLKVRLQAA